MDDIEIIKTRIHTASLLKQEVLADAVLLRQIEKVANLLVEAFRNGRSVYFCGNGGSAADAQHLSAEFSGRFYMDRDPLPAESLTANTSHLTAVGNDYGYDEVFSRAVQGRIHEGDVLVALSTSGNSKNIVNACAEARKKRAMVVGFTGRGGGKMREWCDNVIEAPSSDTPRIQELHMLFGHIICEIVERRLFSSPSLKKNDQQEAMLPDVPEVVVLAAGLGTRLRAVMPDLPKPMAPVVGRPFLEFVLDALVTAGVPRIVLAVAYKAEVIRSYFGDSYKGIPISYSYETFPISPGNSLCNALKHVTGKRLLVANGDTFFPVSIKELLAFHIEKDSDATMAITKVNDVSRYGSVVIDSQKRIAGFHEKGGDRGAGVINGGVYVFERSILEPFSPTIPFAIEKEIFSPRSGGPAVHGYESNAFFIDIGIPEDYIRAQTEPIFRTILTT